MMLLVYLLLIRALGDRLTARLTPDRSPSISLSSGGTVGAALYHQMEAAAVAARSRSFMP